MKVVLLASVLLLSLLYGVQGKLQCVSLDDDYYWDYGNEDFDEDFNCGCQIQDVDGEPIFNVSLDFIDEKYVFYHCD